MGRRFILLTHQPTFDPKVPRVRVNVDHIISYWKFDDDRSALVVTGQTQMLYVTETPEEIDRMITRTT